MRIERLLEERGGAARRVDLVGRSGASGRSLDRRLAEMVAAGDLVRSRRGLYVLPGVDPAVVASVAAGGAISCVSAAHRWGLPLLTPPSRLHLAVSRTASGRIRSVVPAGTELHWDQNLDPGRAARPEWTAIALSHVPRCLAVPEAVAVLDAAVSRGLVRVADLRRLRPRRDWAPYERMLRLVDPRSQSIGESIARVALVGAGFDVATQVQLDGVGAVDLVVDGLVVVEIDGFACHSGRAEYRQDRRRDRAIAIEHGLLELRFAFEDAVHDVPGFVETVRRAVTVARVRRRRTA